MCTRLFLCLAPLAAASAEDGDLLSKVPEEYRETARGLLDLLGESLKRPKPER